MMLNEMPNTTANVPNFAEVASEVVEAGAEVVVVMIRTP
jgi:hypothetical protein